MRSPDGVTEGPHHVEVKAYDIANTEAVAAIDIDVGPPCTATTGCHDKSVCVMGACVPGPSVPGGLGDTCSANDECLDLQCVEAEGGAQYCVEACDGSAESCPSGFQCLEGGNVCWPVPEAGCCSSGADPRGALVISFGVLGFVLRRRRR
jgi:MYXO-CTERM domain-containing protein